MSEDQFRVAFDTNAGDAASGYLLYFPDSVKDLEQMGDELRERAIVTLYMPDEVEVTAQLTFDHTLNCWRGVPLKPLHFRDLL